MRAALCLAGLEQRFQKSVELSNELAEKNAELKFERQRQQQHVKDTSLEMAWAQPAASGSAHPNSDSMIRMNPSLNQAPSAVSDGSFYHGEGPLPPGWTAAVDPGGGGTYYVDGNTQTAQWERPRAGKGGILSFCTAIFGPY